MGADNVNKKMEHDKSTELRFILFLIDNGMAKICERREKERTDESDPNTRGDMRTSFQGFFFLLCVFFFLYNARSLTRREHFSHMYRE